MLLTTILREAFTAERFARVSERDLVTDDANAVAAFARAAAPDGILSGVHAFFIEQAGRLIQPGDRVLDLGCGPGTHLVGIAARHPDAHIIGTDASPAMIAAARATALDRHIGNIDWRVDDMSELASVAPASIDVVLSSMALHHLRDSAQLARCFEAIARVLKPGGRLFIMDFGRLRSLKSVDYFVQRAIPRHEPILVHDYRASLRAAFSRGEFATALPPMLRSRVAIYATAVSPLMLVLTTPVATPARANAASTHTLPARRRADYRHLALFLRLGGMPVR